MARVLICSNLAEAMEAKRHHEITSNTRFACYKCDKGFGSISIQTATAVHFEEHHKVTDGKQVYDGVPFICIGQKLFDCQFGPDRKKKAKANKKQKLEDHSYKKGKKFLMNETKKLDCKARIVMRELCRFPLYKRTEEPRNVAQEKMAAEDLLARIKRGEEIPFVRQFVVVLPDIAQHSHHSAIPEPIDPLLSKKIKDMVDNGIVDLKTIQLQLKDYVRTTVSPIPHPANKRFYPADTTIRNHIYKARNKTVVDEQMKVANWVSELKRSGDFVHYRLKGEGEYESANSDFEVGSKFLFVYQSDWQKRLLDKYGCMVFLDATYKTTLYDLPLFFLAVKTNFDYQIVGCFVTEDETIVSISEALSILKDRFSYMPEYFMTDNDDSEIVSLESVFPESKVLICAFHREQAWERWASKKENTSGDGKQILNMLRNVAFSRTPERFQDSVESLRKSGVYARNMKFRNYFEREWFPKHERWSNAFRRDYTVVAGSTNGIEAQHKVFKQSCLRNKSNYGLFTMLELMIKDFFPSRYIKYIDANQLCSGKFRKSSSEIPVLLQNRPKHFTKLCLENMEKVKDVKRESLQMYHVSLGNNEEWPSCDCIDWTSRHIPCIHMCATMRLESWEGWDILSPLYLQSIFFTIDEIPASDR